MAKKQDTQIQNKPTDISMIDLSRDILSSASTGLTFEELLNQVALRKDFDEETKLSNKAILYLDLIMSGFFVADNENRWLLKANAFDFLERDFELSSGINDIEVDENEDDEFSYFESGSIDSYYDEDTIESKGAIDISLTEDLDKIDSEDAIEGLTLDDDSEDDFVTELEEDDSIYDEDDEIEEDDQDIDSDNVSKYDDDTLYLK